MNLLSVLCPKRDSLHSAKVARRREPKGEQQGERNAGEIQKRRARMNLLSVLCPKRDSNPHSRKGQGILSPSCLPFHHQGNDGFRKTAAKIAHFCHKWNTLERKNAKNVHFL